MAKIVIADDDPDILSIASMTLGKAGHLIIETTTGDEALDEVLNDHPDLMQIDYHMPPGESAGLVTIMKLRDMGVIIPMILMTLNPSQQVAVQSIREKVDDFIPKPFNSRDLAAHVERVLDEHREKSTAAQLLDALSKLYEHAQQADLGQEVVVIDAGKLIARLNNKFN